jgi:hypothetical protein
MHTLIDVLINVSVLTFPYFPVFSVWFSNRTVCCISLHINYSSLHISYSSLILGIFRIACEENRNSSSDIILIKRSSVRRSETFIPLALRAIYCVRMNALSQDFEINLVLSHYMRLLRTQICRVQSVFCIGGEKAFPRFL